MKKITSLIILGLMSLTSLIALEPIKVAITNNSTSAVSVQVKLNDYTGGTATTKYTGAIQSLTPNGSGIIIAQVTNNVGTDWEDITPIEVNSYYVLDVLVGGTLYAQYRLDRLILNQSQSTIYNNDGNLTPNQSGANNLGEDNNRWGELYVQGNTIHIGPDGGMAGTDELALSYNDVTNTATVTVAGTNELLVNSDGIVINGGITANPTGADKDFIFGDDDFSYTSGTESKMFFDKSKGAFRVGSVGGNNWNDGNIGIGSIATGNGNTASGDYSTAMGRYTEASGFTSTAFGISTNATSNYTLATGSGTTASGNSSTAMGNMTTASGDNSTAMGNSTTASGIYSIAMGNLTTASGNSSTAMGRLTKASGSHTTALGWGTEASNESSTAMGYFTLASGEYSTAMGRSTIASGPHSLSTGINTTASGDVSTALGSNTIANGFYSTAMGYYTTASAARSTAIGSTTIADESSSLAMGEYNDNTVTGELLTIGNGSFGTRSNAFEVYRNGNVVIGDDANATHTVRGIMNMNQGINANGSSSSVAVHFSATAPSSPVTGSLWYDTGASALKIWNGGAWVNI